MQEVAQGEEPSKTHLTKDALQLLNSLDFYYYNVC